MKVSLLAITKPVRDGIDTPEQLLAYCARVSSTANQMNHATGPRLLRFLIERGEWSPLEMVNLVIEVEVERDVARQMLRHQLRPQEFSQRYARVLRPFTRRRARLQDHRDRQNSIETDAVHIQLSWSIGQWLVATVCGLVYRAALRLGIAKEVARSVLPEGMTMSCMYMNGYLRNWIHYCEARCDSKTQKEHREVAFAIKAILEEQFPALRGLIAPNHTKD